MDINLLPVNIHYVCERCVLLECDARIPNDTWEDIALQPLETYRDAQLPLLKTFILQHSSAIQQKLIQLLLPLGHFVSTYLKVHILQKSAIKCDKLSYIGI